MDDYGAGVAAVAEVRWLAVWIAVALLGGLAASVLAGPSSDPFERDDAVACGERIADELGYRVQLPQATERDGDWEVTAAGDGALLRLVIRAADERITDVEVLRGGTADVLTRDERLVALEAGCG